MNDNHLLRVADQRPTSSVGNRTTGQPRWRPKANDTNFLGGQGDDTYLGCARAMTLLTVARARFLSFAGTITTAFIGGGTATTQSTVVPGNEIPSTVVTVERPLHRGWLRLKTAFPGGDGDDTIIGGSDNDTVDGG